MRNYHRRSVSYSPKGRRKRSSDDLALGMLEHAAKSVSFFLSSDKERKVVSEIVDTGYVPSPDQELATVAVAAVAGMHKF